MEVTSRTWRNNYKKLTVTLPEMIAAVRNSVYYKDGVLLRIDTDTRSDKSHSGGRVKFHIGGAKIYEHHVVWLLHRDDFPLGLDIDHINGDFTDNRIENLRLANRSENCSNIGKRKLKRSHSKYKGVSYRKDCDRWIAYINKDYKRTMLGYFHSEVEAALAYNESVRMYHGEFALLNQIEEG